PLRARNEPWGRAYLTPKGSRSLGPSDLEFLLQVLEQVTPVVETIRLVDRLASNAAEQERKKIARDIHDSVIQPYIGLQLGLVGLRQKIERGGGGILRHVIDLSALN